MADSVVGCKMCGVATPPSGLKKLPSDMKGHMKENLCSRQNLKIKYKQKSQKKLQKRMTQIKHETCYNKQQVVTLICWLAVGWLLGGCWVAVGELSAGAGLLDPCGEKSFKQGPKQLPVRVLIGSFCPAQCACGRSISFTIILGCYGGVHPLRHL